MHSRRITAWTIDISTIIIAKAPLNLTYNSAQYHSPATDYGAMLLLTTAAALRAPAGGGAPSLQDSTGFIHNHNVDAKCIHRFQYSTMQKLHAFNRHYDKPALTCLVPDYRKSAYKFNTYILRLCRSQSSLPFPTVWQISDRQAEVDPASFLEQPK